MAYRNFDQHDRYYTIDGNPLQGCLEFMVKGGNTKANIYDRNRVPLANPQLTDSLGRADEQVFVDSDVVAYVYKYIGEGRFGEIEENSVDTSDQSMWSLQYTVESVMDTSSTVSTDAAPAVMTMSELRALVPGEVPLTDGVKVVCLHGYYSAGDKAPVWYIWDGASTDTDDNGSIIKPDSLLTGRWILVQPELVCDSRHFGVFPQDSASALVDHTTGITQLVEYCNAHGLKPMFNGSLVTPYFIYNFLTVSSRNPVVVSRGTIFVDKQQSQFYGEWEGDPRFQNGLTKVSASTVKASWNFSDAITYQTVYLDDTCQMTSFSDADVYVTVPTAGKTFTHCNIFSDGKLANNTFSDCVLRGSMFTNESISPTIDDGCTIQPLDFAGRMDLWCTLRSQQHAPVIDVCMQTLDSHCTISLDGVYFKDALFDGFRHESSVSVGFEDCKGSLTLVATGDFTMTSEDSELNVTFEGTADIGSGYRPSINVHDGNLAFVGAMTYLASLGSSGSALSGGSVLVNGDVSLDNVNIGMPITLRGALDMRYCTMNSNMLHYTIAQVARVKMEHCNLNAYYTLQPSVADTTVSAVWSHNFSSVDSPIVLVRTYMDPIDSHHDYVYAENGGGFLPYKTKTVPHTFTIQHRSLLGSSTPVQPPNDPYVLTQQVLGGNDADTNGTPNGYIFPWYTTAAFDTIKMFRIGVDRFRVNAELTTWPAILESPGSTDEYKYNRYHDAQLGAYFKSGFEWGVMPYWDDITQMDLSVPFSASPNFFKGSLSFSLNNMPTFSDYSMEMSIRYECLDRHDME